MSNGCRAILGELSRLFAVRDDRSSADNGQRPRVLAIVAPGPNLTILKAQSRHSGWSLLLSRRQAEVPAIVICDRELDPHRWRDLIRAVTQDSPRPYVILLSPTADANLWEEFHRLGGSDIVRTPVQPENLVESVERGWRFWRNQQRVRAPRAEN